MIAGKDVSQHFCKYEPAKEYVKKSAVTATYQWLYLLHFARRLFEKKKKIEEDLVREFEGEDRVPVTCAEVECMFEFVGYSYRGGQEEQQGEEQEEERSLSRSPLFPTRLKDRQPPLLPSEKDNRTRFGMPKKHNVSSATNPNQFTSLSDEPISPISPTTSV